MPVAKSTPARLAALEAATNSGTRYQDFALKLCRKKDGSVLLRTGGRWDRIKRVMDGTAPRCKVVMVEESQVEFVEWFASWLDKRRAGDTENRDRLVLAGGPRRSGKTFITVFSVIAAAMDSPGSINWIVSPTFQQRDEIERLLKGKLPKSWWRYRDAPIYRFTLINGATIQLLSSDDPETLKRGGASMVLWNEAQNMSLGAISYGLPAIIDGAGLGLLAANPPRRQKGEWILSLRDAMIEQSIPHSKYLAFAAGLNDSIDQFARDDIGQILSVIDPKAAIADDEGAWLPVGDRAYPKFDKKRNLLSPPQLGDVTHEWVKRKLGRGYGAIGAADFQGNPWQCAVVIRVFKGLDDNNPIYYVTDEQLTDGPEEDFLVEFEDRDYTPTDLMFVGDASGAFQSGDHTRGRQSFSIFKKYGWRIVPPREKLTKHGEHSSNPHIDDRLNLVNKLLAQGRLMIDPHNCPRLAESLKECELKLHMSSRRPYGRHAHITDALGYGLYWLEPRTKIHRKPSSAGMSAMSIPMRGPRML